MKCLYRPTAWLRCFAVLGGLAFLSYLLFIENYENNRKNDVAHAPVRFAEPGAAYTTYLTVWDHFGSSSYFNVSIDVVLIFTRSQESRTLANKLKSCIVSMLATRKDFSLLLHLHVLTDAFSLQTARNVLKKLAHDQSSLQVSIYDLERLVEPLREIVSFLQPHFSYKPGAYYSDALFFLSVAIHRVLPMKRILMLDVDTRFAEDILNLWTYFDYFSSQAVVGLAHEQQPVYYHLLREYRILHSNSSFGAAPKNKGNPGFNSGVLLLNLERMRNSELYNSFLNVTVIDRLTEKFQFKGHLGDQDFFTLLSFDRPELFHVLPCIWNRQLCQWWRYHGYADVFMEFYRCDGLIKLYHGNCNSPMPSIKPKET